MPGAMGHFLMMWPAPVAGALSSWRSQGAIRERGCPEQGFSPAYFTGEDKMTRVSALLKQLTQSQDTLVPVFSRSFTKPV